MQKSFHYTFLVSGAKLTVSEASLRTFASKLILEQFRNVAEE